MVVFGWLHLLSLPLTLVSAFLVGCPDKRRLSQRFAIAALCMAVPVLVVVHFLPSMLGSDAAGVIGMLLVSPMISIVVLVMMRRWRKR